jgi:hypothetical protein
MKRLIQVMLILGSLLASVGCSRDSPPANGFTMLTQDQDSVNGVLLAPRTAPHIQFTSHFAFGNPTVGTLTDCSGETDGNGLFPCANRKAPGFYAFTFVSGFCFGEFISLSVQPADFAYPTCLRVVRTLGLAPNSIDVNAPPATIEITGEQMSGNYGMPVVRIVDPWSGNIVASATASTLSADGTWMQAPTPYLGSVYSGQYLATVSNVVAGGSLEVVGAAWLEVYGNDPPPPPPDPCGPGYGGIVMPCDAY